MFLWNCSRKCQKRTTCDFYLTILLWLLVQYCLFSTPGKKLSNALHLNAVFTKENKIKTKLYKSMFMYSPWICLLMMGVGVTDYYRSTSFLPDKQLSVDFRLFSKIINLRNSCDFAALWTLPAGLCACIPIWFLHFSTAVLLRHSEIIFCCTKANRIFLENGKLQSV